MQMYLTDVECIADKTHVNLDHFIVIDCSHGVWSFIRYVGILCLLVLLQKYLLPYPVLTENAFSVFL